MSAPTPDKAVSPLEFAAAVAVHLISTEQAAPATLAQVVPIIENFGAFVQHGLGIGLIQDVEAWHAEAFLGSRQVGGQPASYGTRRIRRMALRMGFRAGRHLGVVRHDPTLDLDLAPGRSVSARPLTDQEILLGRSHAMRSLEDMRRSIAWALAEATARTSEMGCVSVGDVAGECDRVWLPGSPTTEPRWGHLTDWGRLLLRRRVAGAADATDPLIVWRTKPKTPRAACSQAVKETLKAAGLWAADVKPRSIAAWAGRKAFDEGAGIDEVARMVGMRSLDQTAEFIAFDWRAGEVG